MPIMRGWQAEAMSERVENERERERERERTRERVSARERHGSVECNRDLLHGKRDLIHGKRDLLQE